MLVSRTAAALATASLAALALAVPAAQATTTPRASAVSAAPASAPASALRKHKQKKIRVGYTIATIKGAYDYTFTVSDKKGRPVPGVRFNLQYHAVKGQWDNEGIKYTSDANGQFHYVGCNISFGVQRMHTNATKKHSAASAKFQLQSC